MGKTVLAIGCHPDDIEFMMAGTLFLLKEAGCEVHVAHIANGDCGSTRLSRRRIARVRRAEAMAAAGYMGASYHGSFAPDLGVFYEASLVRRATALVREVAPDIVLAPSLDDYMEDHMNAGRIAATAAFARGMPNYRSVPRRGAESKDVALYHALPYGLRDAMGNRVRASIYVDIGRPMDRKRRMLSFHESQRTWLDETQSVDSYVENMVRMAREVGVESEAFELAEGWRQHGALGLSVEGYDPLVAILGPLTRVSAR